MYMVAYIDTQGERGGNCFLGKKTAISNFMDLVNCADVESVDLIDRETGEVLVSVVGKRLTWLSSGGI